MEFFYQISGGQLILTIPGGVALGVLCYLFCYFWKMRKFSFFKKLGYALLLIYLGALLSLTIPILLPSGIHLSMESFDHSVRSIIWKPFEASLEIYRNCRQIGNMDVFFRLIGGNFILLMPLGFLLPLLYPRLTFLKGAVFGIFASAFIETVQFIGGVLYGAPIRTVEIDDVLLNSAGYLLALAVACIARRLFPFGEKS